MVPDAEPGAWAAFVEVALLVAVGLIPLGAVYGIVARTALLIRRRGAGRTIAPLTRRATAAAGFATELQAVQRLFDVILLAIALVGGAVWIATSAVTERAG